MRGVTRMPLYAALAAVIYFEMTLLEKISVSGIFPDITVIFVVFTGLFCGARLGGEIGLAAGLLKDLLGIGIFGANIFVLGLSGIICGLLSDKVYRQFFLTQFTLSFISCLLVTRFSVAASLYTGLLSPVVFFILVRVYGFREEF